MDKTSLTARVITISTRAAAGIWQDTSGPIIVEALTNLGFNCAAPTVIPDGPEIVDALKDAVNHNINVVITTGGTGHTPNDVTPEMTLQVIERHSPGIAEAIRSYGVASGVPTAILSRGVAGIAGKTFIVNLPGSAGGVRDGMKVLGDVLVHLVDQMNGGDHTRKD